VPEDDFAPSVAQLTASNSAYADSFDLAGLPVPPSRNLAVVTCMDCRIDVLGMLGLAVGEAHVMRNAGGVVTDDTIRSLCLSQRLLGTKEIVLVHHTACGLQGVDGDALLDELEAELGKRPAWSVQSFADPFDDVRKSIDRLIASPFVPHGDWISGFVYDVSTGRLHPVD